MTEVVDRISGLSEKGRDLQEQVALVGQVLQKRKCQHLPTVVEVWQMSGWNRVDLVKSLQRLGPEEMASRQTPTLTLAQDVWRSLLEVE